jgi:hypothetical protein
MGLDMYLQGKVMFWGKGSKPVLPQSGGFPVSELSVELGYWRKHPNLHGFIVQTFADGADECQDIELDAACIATIIKAVEDKALPHTEGFFFGQSEGSEQEMQEDLAIFKRALEWLALPKQDNIARYVEYRASW